MKSKIPKSAITEKQLRKKVVAAANKKGSIASWAVDNEITPQVVSAFLRRTQGAGLQIPEVFGYRPQIVFIPLKEKLISHLNPPRKTTKNQSKKTKKVK